MFTTPRHMSTAPKLIRDILRADLANKVIQGKEDTPAKQEEGDTKPHLRLIMLFG
jgi:hypothetical protein